jgi:hypothetical protein
VLLLCARADNSLSVVIVDTRTEESFELPVRADEAMDAFRHPFFYAATRHLGSTLASLVPALTESPRHV